MDNPKPFMRRRDKFSSEWPISVVAADSVTSRIMFRQSRLLHFTSSVTRSAKFTSASDLADRLTDTLTSNPLFVRHSQQKSTDLLSINHVSLSRSEEHTSELQSLRH